MCSLEEGGPYMAQEQRTGASQTPLYYWGEGGQYGPFERQRDGEWEGWPNFGQVMRYFRKKLKLSAKAFGERYGKEVNEDGSAISERWILKMELENDLPVDINKRKTIALLLNIPPMLFGLAMLEDVALETQALNRTVRHLKLQRVTLDIEKYSNTTRSVWQMHDTGNAQEKLGQLRMDIQDLERYEPQTQGDLRYQIQETLLGDQLLMTHIVRDQRQFSQAYAHANNAVRVAKSTHDSDFIATALFMRGWTSLEWGLFGTIEQRLFHVQQDKIQAAVRDFQEAMAVFPGGDGKEEMHPQLVGTLTVYLSRAQTALALSRGERVSPSVLLALDGVADTVGRQNIDDLYTRALITGTRKSWHQAGYLNTRATVFYTAGLPGQALQELNALEKLIEKTYRKDETRQFVWLDILWAKIYLALEEYGCAIEHARRALLASQDIHSLTNTAIITDLYGQLLKSPYKTTSGVQELGEILRKQPVSFAEE